MMIKKLEAMEINMAGSPHPRKASKLAITNIDFMKIEVFLCFFFTKITINNL